MEQKNLYEEANDAVIRRTGVVAYACPSRRNLQSVGGRAYNDYAGNGGLRVGRVTNGERSHPRPQTDQASTDSNLCKSE